MIDRYVNIRDAIESVEAVEELVSRGPVHRRIFTLHGKLQELNSVCTKLQHFKRTLSDVRALLDVCLEKYPVMREHLEASAEIVHSPAYKSTVVKLSRDAPLTAIDKHWLEPFRAVVEPLADADEPADFATEILQQANKRCRAVREVKYLPLVRNIPPTSNHCERLFSECKYVLSAHRSSLLPANFEMLMFLKANRDKWSASTLLP